LAAAEGKRSDLPVRVASAVVMVALAGWAFWLGGIGLVLFVGLIGIGVLIEWMQLVLKFERRAWARTLWLLGALVYVGLALNTALFVLIPGGGLLWIVALVVAIDVGAYFAGRTFGGPKIAPRISPSKTWSGLGGATLGATLVLWLNTLSVCEAPFGPQPSWRECLTQNAGHMHIGDLVSVGALTVLLSGLVTAVVAQSGDFFESWMKRRAGVKDSGTLIPGHGGLFDRVDGLLAVLFVFGLAGPIVAMVH
jgi:phosphatidate cytidylyltransferase